jgi:NADPH:quinone reductase-like Zn-dependent oxidoreductase
MAQPFHGAKGSVRLVGRSGRTHNSQRSAAHADAIAGQKAYALQLARNAGLEVDTEPFDSGKLLTDVGTVLPLQKARTAHELLGGIPHKRGKIVLSVNT